MSDLIDAIYGDYTSYYNGPSWTTIYGFIAIFLVIGAIALTIVLSKTALKNGHKQKGFAGAFLDLININGSAFECIVKLVTVGKLAYEILMLPRCFNAGFMDGFISFVSNIIFDIGGILVAYAALMLAAKFYKKYAALNEHLGVKEPEPVVIAAPAPVETAPATKICLGCGKEIKDGAKFCPFCGTNQ